MYIQRILLLSGELRPFVESVAGADPIPLGSFQRGPASVTNPSEGNEDPMARC